MTYEEFMPFSGGARRRSDAKITIDIFDIASMLTHYFQDRGFLAPDEKLDPFDLTVERKNGEIKIRWDSK